MISKALHPLAKRLLYFLGDAPYLDSTTISFETLEKELSTISMVQGQYNQAVSALVTDKLLREVGRIHTTLYERTDYGIASLSEGLPELRMLETIEQADRPYNMAELAQACNISPAEAGPVFGRLCKLNVLAMNKDGIVLGSAGSTDSTAGSAGSTDSADAIALIRKLPDYLQAPVVDEKDLSKEELQMMAQFSKKRGVSAVYFRLSDREEVQYALTEAGIAAAKELRALGHDVLQVEVSALTPEMLRDGSWKDKTFRSYNVQVPPVRKVIGRRNPYTEYLDEVRDKLVALGFEEFDGSLVETDFWNSDALFMPQFHSARDIHDVYYVKNPQYGNALPEPFLSNVAAVHEHGGNTGSRGWMYPFDKDMARRMILRSQGTVLSARQLPKARVPGKYFGIVRCFRHDQVDATHLSDFYQVEGIILGEEVNLCNLLGMLEIFARELADAKEVRFVPGYFPFTEPSVEVHIKHPKLGWFELGGSGIFRPEVSIPLGVDVPVLAWGLGIDRMALMRLGLSDLRELFSGDIDTIRNRRNQKKVSHAKD